MISNQCGSQVREANRKGRRANKPPATVLVQCTGKRARGNLPGSPNTAFMVVIRRL